MAKTIDIELTQNRYTDFIVYDGTQRCMTDDYITLKDISEVTLTFTGPNVINNKIYKFDSTMQGKLTAYAEFEPVNCSGYLEQKSLSLIVDGTAVTGIFEGNYTNTTEMIAALDTQFASLNINFVNNGHHINANTTTTGEDVYIQVVGGDLLDYVNWNIGIYRGNNFSWGDPTVLQKDFSFVISAEDFGYDNGLIPETYWNIQYNIAYDIGFGTNLYIDNITEFTYKQTEIYRAKTLEYISRNFTEFLIVEQRWQTDMEILMQKSIYFDSVYKSFLASIEIGNINRSYELLNILIDYKLLNEIL